MNSKQSTVIATLAVLGLPTAGMAVEVGDVVGSEEEIRTALEAEGYAILEVERENGEIEVEASRDGTVFEFNFTEDTGEVIEVTDESAPEEEEDDTGETDDEADEADEAEDEEEGEATSP